MNNNLRRINPIHRKRKTSPFFARLFLSMLLLSSLQFCTFIATFHAGGAFSYIRNYSYNVLFEKTENRKNYVENALNSKINAVYDANRDINALTEKVLRENGAAAEDLCRNKSLSKQILYESTDRIISLLRRTTANDAYIVLDTGSLYSKRNTKVSPALY
ncbi:MAG: hypothetical protein ACI4JN_04565, partial [Ruminococcus sp.]